MRTTTLRLVIAAVAIGAFAASAFASRFLFVVVGVVAALMLATSFSEAGRLGEALESFPRDAVNVRVWGDSLPGTEGLPMTLVSTRSLGAGLHFYFQIDGRGPVMHLKVAQPSGSRTSDRSVVIERARYIQWESKRLSRGATPAEQHTACMHMELVGVDM